MRYQVPQFIEIEDKIFGPLTLKQFIYLAGGAGVAYLIYALTNTFLPFFIIIIIAIPVLGFAVALAFYKINNKPFIEVVESAIKYYVGGKLYLWKKSLRPAVKQAEMPAQNLLTLPKLADSRLKDLAWNLNISKGEYNDIGIHVDLNQVENIQNRMGGSHSLPSQNQINK